MTVYYECPHRFGALFNIVANNKAEAIEKAKEKMSNSTSKWCAGNCKITYKVS